MVCIDNQLFVIRPNVYIHLGSYPTLFNCFAQHLEGDIRTEGYYVIETASCSHKGFLAVDSAPFYVLSRHG